MPNPIGVTFIPSTQNQNQPQAPANGVGGSNLEQAFKILSLRLPQVLGARAIAPTALLAPGEAAGSSALAPGTNPNAAIFQALLRAMLGGMPPTDPNAGLGGTPDRSGNIGRSPLGPGVRPPAQTSGGGDAGNPFAPPPDQPLPQAPSAAPPPALTFRGTQAPDFSSGISGNAGTGNDSGLDNRFSGGGRF